VRGFAPSQELAVKDYDIKKNTVGNLSYLNGLSFGRIFDMVLRYPERKAPGPQSVSVSFRLTPLKSVSFLSKNLYVTVL
jgi:hypothetical protein